MDSLLYTIGPSVHYYVYMTMFVYSDWCISIPVFFLGLL